MQKTMDCCTEWNSQMRRTNGYTGWSKKKQAVVDDKKVIVIMIKKISKWHENKNAELFD
jgi:hypothetical protein